jgi:hypothetical protein
MAAKLSYGSPARASRLASQDTVAVDITSQEDAQERFAAPLWELQELSMELQARNERAERQLIADVNLAVLKHVRELREIRAAQRRFTTMLQRAA